LISFLQSNTDPAIKHLITVSPGTAWNPNKLEQTIADIQQANKDIETSENTIEKYSLGFCEHNYKTTANNFLSYANWTETVLLKSFEDIKIKTQVIIGNNDPYIPNNWAKKLRKKNINVTVIDGANHFFNGDAEFLLQDNIINILDNNR